jgi:hypothetical protein
MAIWRLVVRIQSPVLGGVGTNTWHLRSDSLDPLDPEGPPEVAGIIQTFYGGIRGLLPNSTTVSQDGTVQGVQAAEGQTQNVTPWSYTGTGGPPSLPPALAIVVGWKSASGGRSGRGRTFLGPFSPDAAQDNGTIADSALQTIRDQANLVVTSSTGNGNGAVGIYSPQDGILRDITAAAVRDQFAVLRSRRD